METSSLRLRLTVGISLLILTSLATSSFTLRTALQERGLALRYERLNRLASRLSEAAGFHAMERGVGNTLLNTTGRNEVLERKLNEVRRKADQAVEEAEHLLRAVRHDVPGEAFPHERDTWRATRAALQSARETLAHRQIDSTTWIAVTSHNTEQELALRRAIFSPSLPSEKVLARNIGLRADVAQLCEFAGRERAELGGHIAARQLLDSETLKRLARYRALVDQALNRIICLKDLSDTPADLRRVIAAFESEFLGPYQILREKVYAASAAGSPYPIDGATWIERATKAIDAGLAIGPVAARLSDESADELRTQANRYLASSSAALAFTFVISAVLFLYFQRVSRRLGQVATFVGELCGSQRIARCEVTGADEIGRLAAAINAMLDDLRDSLERAQLAHRARLEAESIGEAKATFLANMSHEFRTPLTAIMGFTDLLFDSGLPATERTAYLETIRRNSDHLLGVINDILDFSKIQAGELRIVREPCSVCRIVADVAATVRICALAKSIQLNVRYQFPIPETIQTDALRLRQILLNLAGNAVKFTDDGIVQLTVRADGLDAAEPFITIEVTDTGIGMNELQLSQVFRPFKQAVETATRRFGGTGLGLCISRHLAEMLGGELTVRSKLGEGSEFIFQCPVGDLTDVSLVHDVQEALAEPERSPSNPLVALNGRILLAEDGPDNQRLIGLLLRSAGAEVEIVENGRLAVEAALTATQVGRPFDLLLMDIQMPELDGYAATSELRALEYRGSIVALTAHASCEDKARCLRFGFDDFASKPIQRGPFLALVSWHLSRGRTNGQHVAMGVAAV